MDLSNLSGTIACVLFVCSQLPMLWKAFHTKDLRSYSPQNLVLASVGNVFYWVYVASLPIGPIWLLHAYNTIATFLMLWWYARYVIFTGSHR